MRRMQTKLQENNHSDIYVRVWGPLKEWIKNSGWKGTKYTSNDDLIPSLAESAGAVLKEQIGSILAWMSKKGYVEILPLSIGYAQIFPKFTDNMDEDFMSTFIRRLRMPDGSPDS